MKIVVERDDWKLESEDLIRMLLTAVPAHVFSQNCVLATALCEVLDEKYGDLDERTQYEINTEVCKAAAEAIRARC